MGLGSCGHQNAELSTAVSLLATVCVGVVLSVSGALTVWAKRGPRRNASTSPKISSLLNEQLNADNDESDDGRVSVPLGVLNGSDADDSE